MSEYRGSAKSLCFSFRLMQKPCTSLGRSEMLAHCPTACRAQEPAKHRQKQSPGSRPLSSIKERATKMLVRMSDTFLSLKDLTVKPFQNCLDIQ